MKHLLQRFCIGIAMGICDAVPGISGSTMALIAGIYHQLIDQVQKILLCWRHPKQFIRTQLIDTLRFFLPLGAGIVCGLALALKLLIGDHGKELKAALASDDSQAVEQAMAMQNGWLLQSTCSANCFGDIFWTHCCNNSIPWSQRPQWRSRNQQRPNRVVTLRGALYFSIATVIAAGTSFISMQLTPTTPLLILGGFCAIVAMLLPGISGSLVLLVIGLYQPISIAAPTSISPSYCPSHSVLDLAQR